MSQVKVAVGAALVAGTIALGAAALARQDGAAKPNPAPPAPEVSQAPARGKLTPLQLRHAEAEVQRQLRGTWEAVRSVQDGKEFRPEVEYERLVFDGEFRVEFRVRPREAVDGRRDESIGRYTVMVNPDKSPAEMTIFGENFLILGIHELVGDDLKIAFFGRSEIDRPRGMTRDGNGLPLIIKTYRRVGP